MAYKEGGLEELGRKYWFKNTAAFASAMRSVGAGAITFMVMYEWREKTGDKRLCFEQLDKSDKFKFMHDVLMKTKKIGIFEHKKRMPDFEIKDSIESMGFDMKDYL